MKNSIYITLTLLIGIYISSCESNPDIIEVPLSKTAKEYCDFKPGSYWIYKDSINGVIDSVCLISRKEQLTEYGIVRYEEIIYNCYSSHLHQSSPATFGLEGIDRKLTNWYHKRSKVGDSVYTAFGASRYYSFHPLFLTSTYINGISVSDGATQVSFVKKYDSLIINSNTYYNVKKFANNQIQSYFAKNVGLIKIIKPDPSNPIITEHNWKLLRYDVQQ